MKKPMIIQSVLCSLFGIGLLFNNILRNFSDSSEILFANSVNVFDQVIFATLLVIVIGLMMAIYVLFVLHRRINKYSKKIEEKAKVVAQETVVEETLVEEAPAEEVVEEAPVEEAPVEEVVEEATVEEALVEEVVEEAIAEEVVEETPIEEEIVEHKHALIKHDAVEATCVEEGSVLYFECSECGQKFADENCETLIEDVQVVALGHDEVKHDAKVPTCTEVGNYEYVTCSRCEYTTYEEIPAMGHDEVKHDAKVPTCTEVGNYEYVTCSRCEYTTYEEIPALGHKLVEHESVEPTETEEGSIHYYECEQCHKVFEDAEATIELDNSQLSIPKLVEEKPVEVVVEEEAPVEEVVEEPIHVVDSALASHEMQDLIQESVTVEEAREVLEDSQLKELVESQKQYPKYKSAKKEKYIINVDILSENFVNGDIVDLDSLKAKNLLPKKCNYFKVLARGRLDKVLEVIANDFSNDAIKMILVTGGKVVKIEE